MKKVVTDFWRKPIPTNKYDWTAWYDGEEENGEYGYGSSEQGAIEDLKSNYPA